MPVSRPPTRFAHTNGHTDLCYSDDGQHILTSGSEGDIRIWTSPTDDNQFDKCIGDVVFAVAQKCGKIYVGADNNSVQIFTYPAAELDGMLTRFTAPVTDISVTPDGKFVAASSRDMQVHVCNTTTGTVTTFTGHVAPVLSVAMDPRHEYVVSSSCDGSVRVWNIADQTVVKKWEDVLPASKSFTLSRTLCRMSWQPVKGYYLAVPFGEEIHIFDRKVWEKKFTVTSSIMSSQLFSICAWSPDEQFLAAGTTNGDILFWSLKKGKVTEISSQKKKGSSVCGLTWNPDIEKKELAYSDTEGHFGVVENCCSEEILASDFEMEEELNMKAAGREKNKLKESGVEDLFSEPLEFDDDEEDENDISLDKIKSQYPLEEDALSTKDAPSVREGSESRLSNISAVEKPILPQLYLQAPFQPSSTPLHLNHRFMLWNNVGTLYHYNTEEENAIQVEFHDAEFHHHFRIDNILGHHIAALSEHALALACESQNDTASKLVCVLLKAWDGSKEWSVELPGEEQAVSVAAGDSWVAVATDARILRIFSLSGCQKQIISIPGPTICMAGHGRKLVVVYHGGTPIPDDQALSYIVYDTDRLYSSSLSQPLPIAPKSELRWLGFTDEGSVCITDSSGMLRILVNRTTWQPICNVDAQTKNKLDHYFVLGVSETSRKIRCLLCKGAIYPRTTPKPIVTEISWQIPLCEVDCEKGQLEDKLWQLILVKRNLEALGTLGGSYLDAKKMISKDILTSGLKLFALACKNDSDMRALEVVEMIGDPVFNNLAIKYVENRGKTSLISRLSELDYRNLKRERSPSPDFQRQNRSTNSVHRNSLREPPSVNIANNELSQDVFGEENDENREDNLIVAYKKRKAAESLSSSISPSPQIINPFKKKNVSGGNEGLDALDVVKKKEPVSKNSFSLDKKMSMRKTKKDADAAKPNKKITFLEWFESEKSNLQEEFPELDLSELSKTAMKRFKALKSSTQLEKASQNSTKERDLKSFFSFASSQSTIQPEESQGTINDTEMSEAPMSDATMYETPLSEVVSVE
ncbi:unnamed protein product [Bemisia tabaci]|uniref:WD repeat and HMG-box DNA-binding protein 1 n=1 Tax=Bemisia tabaci TaxID=7038 RepID=A0A9P0AEZ6_BEMTA|nr:unnamed protein product [Bemisia tabaci]